MRVYTPGEVAKHAGNKYLGVLVAAKFARVLERVSARSFVIAGEEADDALARRAVERRDPVPRGAEAEIRGVRRLEGPK